MNRKIAPRANKIRRLRPKSSLSNRSTVECITDSNEKDDTYFGSIPGFRNIVAHKNNLVAQALWLLIVLTCTVSCGYQAYDRIHHFFQYPVDVKVQIHRMSFMVFPAIVVCPGEIVTNVYELKQDCNKKNNIPDYCDMLKNISALHVEGLWNMTAIPINALKLLQPKTYSFDGEVEENPVDNLEQSYVDTVWGRCVLNNYMGNMKYLGPNTYIKLQIMENELLEGTSTVQVYIHDRLEDKRHNAMFQARPIFLQNYTYWIQLTSQQFQYPNTWHSPCSTENIGSCTNKCIDEKLKEQDGCKLPFMPLSKGNMCNNWKDTVQAFQNAYEFYANDPASNCSCMRACTETVYNSNDFWDDNDVETNITTVIFYYNDNQVATITETPAYSVSALFSDIGGSFGFLLGCSILTVFEFVDLFLMCMCGKGRAKVHHKRMLMERKSSQTSSKKELEIVTSNSIS